MVLFKRFPRFIWKPPQPYSLVPPAERDKCADMKDDFQLLEQELVPYFNELDRESLRFQNEYRREQVVIILGGAILTTLGAIQTAIGTIWPGLVEAIISVVLTIFTLRSRELKWQERYFTNRLRAETLRGEYFKFLGKIAPYEGDAQARIALLTEMVAGIRAKGVDL